MQRLMDLHSFKLGLGRRSGLLRCMSEEVDVIFGTKCKCGEPESLALVKQHVTPC